MASACYVPDVQRDREPSRLFVRASTEHLQISSTSITTPPFTVACWFATDNAADSQALLMIGDKDILQKNWRLQLRGAGAGNTLAMIANDNPDIGIAESAIAWSTNVWQHACGIEIAANSRAVYLNGGNKGTDVTNVVPPGVDSIQIGRLPEGTSYMSGRIFWPCIWKVALTGAERAALGNRQNPTPPWEIRPESIGAMPNMRTMWDPFLKTRWTPTGTVPANPPWLWRPRHVSMYVPAVAGGLSRVIGGGIAV